MARRFGDEVGSNADQLVQWCGNGKPAPVQAADWQMWVQELRDAGMGAYKVGQAKNADAILEAAGAVSEACLHCHQKYRNVPGGIPNRC